jgi:hypothetical protein
MKRKKYSYIGARFSGKEVEPVDAVDEKHEKKKPQRPKADERKKSFFSHENHDDLFDREESGC